MPSREPELYKDKIEVSLDGRQIFYLFFGGAVIVGLVFVLGVLVGRRVEARGHLDRAETQAETDPLAALDRLERSDRLSFHGALRGGEAATDVEKAIGELEKRRAAGKPDKKPEPPASAVAKADPRPARLDKLDEPITHPESERARADRAEKSDKVEKADRTEKSERSDAAAGGDKKTKKHDEAATEARLESRSDSKPDAKSDKKAESKADSKAESKADSRADSKAESKADSKSESKPDSKPDSKAESKADARSESRSNRSEARRSDAKPDKPVTRPDAKADARESRGDKRTDTAAAGSESRSDDARPASEGKARFTLQLSSFQDKAEADAFLATTKSAGFQPYVVEADVTGKGTFYRVRLGSYRSIDAANDAKADYERTAKKTAQVTRL